MQKGALRPENIGPGGVEAVAEDGGFGAATEAKAEAAVIEAGAEAAGADDKSGANSSDKINAEINKFDAEIRNDFSGPNSTARSVQTL